MSAKCLKHKSALCLGNTALFERQGLWLNCNTTANSYSQHFSIQKYILSWFRTILSFSSVLKIDLNENSLFFENAIFNKLLFAKCIYLYQWKIIQFCSQKVLLPPVLAVIQMSSLFHNFLFCKVMIVEQLKIQL